MAWQMKLSVLVQHDFITGFAQILNIYYVISMNIFVEDIYVYIIANTVTYRWWLQPLRW